MQPTITFTGMPCPAETSNLGDTAFSLLHFKFIAEIPPGIFRQYFRPPIS
jgi:hypothetical protein